MTAATSPSGRSVVFPGHRELKELRSQLARGRLPAPQNRTPEDFARVAAFRTLEELLALLEQHRRRLEKGQRCRLVEREHVRAPGRLLLELEIEAQP